MTTATSFSLLLLILLALPEADAAVNCTDAVAKFAPCTGFVTGKARKPSQPCCGGLHQLARQGSTRASRRATCQCVKDGVFGIPFVLDRLLRRAPHACRVKFGYPLSLNTMCDTIK